MPISLKLHNEEAYKKLTEKFKESDRVAIVHPTGTGKMFIALKLLEESKGKKAIYIAPTNAILHDVKKNIFDEGMTMKDFPSLKRITYQKLVKMSDEEIKKLGADIIVLDEFHHCGGPEWGKGVERLIERNPGAKILGLSATPLRYFDGLRDMSDELFDGNVASEMTIEEAIDQGILPEATYVSSVYGLNNEIERLQGQINKMINQEKKQQALSLLEILREQLPKESADLLDLFSSYMQNPNGKYIVFCKNIEDMNEKMEQAQEMFGVVNPNIKVRAVSSQISKSDKVLTEFEQDNDGDTLKLLYTVNMINEGYHIKDLDGVILMRPTYSPTIFTQQIGRALSIGGSKKPVILDLVNNYDSCKIIEDFAERMKQYKRSNKESRSLEDSGKTKFSISDKTKEFREIVKSIMDLTSKDDKPRIVLLDEKIQIFERFAETGEELTGSTMFEGYPIGQWAITIRSRLNNRFDNDTKEESIPNLTEEQMERLTKLGILERQFETTIDEKIDILISWRKDHPNIPIRPIVSMEILKELATSEEEFKQLSVEYEKILNYYVYVRTRKSKGKLSVEQVEKCVQGDIGGVFDSYSLSAEAEELKEKYDIDDVFINIIRKQYGTIDTFRKVYIDALINQNVDGVIPKRILENVKLVKYFDLDSSDWIYRNKGVGDVIFDYSSRPGYYYMRTPFMKYDGLEESIIDFSIYSGLTKLERQVFFMVYGLNGEKRANQAQTATNLGKSFSNVNQTLHNAIRKVMNHTYQSIHKRAVEIDYDLEKQIIEEYFNYFDVFVPKVPVHMDEDIKLKLTNMIQDAIEKTKKRDEQLSIIARMPEETRRDILRAKFGESISKSDFSVVSPRHPAYEHFEEESDQIDIEDVLVDNRDGISDISFRECLNSEYTQSKLIEFIINSFSNSELIEAYEKEKLEDSIDNNGYFVGERKEELKGLLRARMSTAVKEKICEEIDTLGRFKTQNDVLGVAVEDLELSLRTCNSLIRYGRIRTVQDFIGKSEEELMRIQHFGKKGIDEVIEKLKSLGIEPVNHYYELVRKSTFSINEEKENALDENEIINIEREINESNVLDTNEKDLLRERLHERYQKVNGQRICSAEEEQLRSEVMEIVAAISGEGLKEVTIEQLDLSARAYNCVCRAGMRTVQDIVGCSEEEFMRIRNLGQKSYDEVIDKLKSFGIEIVDGYIICANVYGGDSERITTEIGRLEEKINNNSYLSEETKKELRIFVQEKLGAPETDEQDVSKKRLVDSILKKQKIIAEQNKEIGELSSEKKKEKR